MTAITACPCGDFHELSAEVRAFWSSFIGGLPPDVSVSAPGGSWMVPRIYIAVHGLKADELPGLAARYGWAASPGTAAR